MKKTILTGVILVTALVSTARGDLSGRWSCNDGGTYYLRQTGGRVFWYGEAAGRQPAWSNVFSGRIREKRIEGRWVDVPKGRTAGSGSLALLIEANGTALRAVGKTGGFKGSRWRRLPAHAGGTRPLSPLKPSGNDPCIRFDPSALSVRQINGRWKIVAGSHWLFDFASDQTAARQALKVIGHYRMDRRCTIGRPASSFSYMLARGGVPTGAMTREDCVAFDPSRVQVSKIQGRWKIVAGRRWLFDFGSNQGDARRALAVIRRHGFRQSCLVGRPHPGFTYLRR
jgi:hypothetical protein